MSELNDRLNDADKEYEQKQKEFHDQDIIRQAMQKKPGGGRDSGELLGIKHFKPGKFSMTLYIICLILAVAFVMLFLYVSSSVLQVNDVRRSNDELEVLVQEQTDELNALKEHVTAMEAEFRRAFKKDRQDMEGFKAAVEKANQDSEVLLQKFKDDTKMQVINYKSKVAENEALVGKIEREYKGFAEQFSSIQEDFKGLRARVLKMTAPEMK